MQKLFDKRKLSRPDSVLFKSCGGLSVSALPVDSGALEKTRQGFESCAEFLLSLASFRAEHELLHPIDNV